MGILCIAISLIFNKVNGKFFSSKLNSLEKWVIIFISILTVELLFTYRPRDIIAHFLTIFDMFIIPLLVYYITKHFIINDEGGSGKYFKKLLNITMIAGCFIGLMGIYEGVTLDDLNPAPESDFSRRIGGGLRAIGGLARVNGPYYTPETFGVVMSMMFFMVLYKLNMVKKEEGDDVVKKTVHYSMLVICIVAIYFNMFRSIWLAVVLGLGCRFIFVREKRHKMIFIAILAIMFALGSWGIITEQNVYKKRISDSESFYNRVGAWMYCLRAFRENPIMGLGFGKIYKYIEHAQEAGDMIYVEDAEAALEPHETFLTILAENGIIALIPYIFILLAVLRYMLKYRSSGGDYADKEFSVALFSIFMVYFVPMFFDRTGYYPKINNVFYLCLGMLIAKLEMHGSFEEKNGKLIEIV